MNEFSNERGLEIFLQTRYPLPEQVIIACNKKIDQSIDIHLYHKTCRGFSRNLYPDIEYIGTFKSIKEFDEFFRKYNNSD